MSELCLKALGSEECHRPKGHTGGCDTLPAWKDLLQGGIAEDKRVRDKVKRSPTETAGKGGEWGFLQNKVNRASQVAIPLDVYAQDPSIIQAPYDNGYVVYVTPGEYANGDVPDSLTVGRDVIVLYTLESELADHPPLQDWSVFQLRDANGDVVDSWRTSVGWSGEYYVRYKKGSGWKYGGGKAKAIGIRQDEYCSMQNQRYIVGQMAFLAWSTDGTLARLGREAIPAYLLEFLDRVGMLDLDRMVASGMIGSNRTAQCPFCLDELTYEELVNEAPQQVGRRLASSNATALHLMHIEPLKMGEFNHRPYNLAFGHAKCNHAQGEDSIARSVEFLFDKRLRTALDGAGVEPALRQEIREKVRS